MQRRAALATALLLTALGGCDKLPFGGEGSRPGTATEFPSANRPVAPINSPRWSDEDTRDRLGEADDVMNRAGIARGMTVADIGAGEGYYTVRLSERVGEDGRVLAQDIVPEVIEKLGVRVNRERLDNVSIKLGAADDPRLPANSFDRVLMVHMYHEIEEPYAFLWRLWPALRGDGQVIVVDGNRPIAQHGTPLSLLICEFQAVGYRPLEFVEKPNAGGYFARFVRARTRPAPGDIRVCNGGTGA
jgi:SAM-dependent methyltransferase